MSSSLACKRQLLALLLRELGLACAELHSGGCSSVLGLVC